MLNDLFSNIWQALARGGGWDDEDDAGSLRWASAADKTGGAAGIGGWGGAADDIISDSGSWFEGDDDWYEPEYKAGESTTLATSTAS